MNYIIDKNKDVKIISAACITALDEKHITRTLNNYEIFLITDGVLYLEQNGKKYVLEEGDVFISNANQSFGGYRKAHASFYFIHLDVGGYISPTTETNGLIIPQKFHINNFTEIAVIFHQIINYHRKVNCENVTKALLTSIFEMFYYCLHNEQRSALKNNRRFNKAMEDLIFTPHMVGFSSTKEIADKFGYNPRYLSSLFKKYLGASLNEILINAKIDKSKRMLLYSKMEIKEIAHCLDYRSDYFVKFFKKYVGITPTQYRNGLTAKTQEFVNDTNELFKNHRIIG